MNKEMKIVREVNIQADLFYENAKELGELAALVLGKEHRSQMTNLESIVESALKTSDIFDYIKKQTARFEFWRPGYNKQTPDGFGQKLLEYLEDKDKMVAKRDTVCRKLEIGNKTDEHKQERRYIYLLLIRQFIRQIAVHYEYCANIEEGQRRGPHK